MREVWRAVGTARARAAAATAGVVACAAAAACGGESGGTPVEPAGPGPGIHVVAGAGVTDTVLTQPVQALVLEVRAPDGAPARGAVVRFEPIPPGDPLRPNERAIFACPLAAPSCGPTVDGFAGPYGHFAADTADAAGRVQALIRLGTVAGPAAITVTAPELGFADTVRFTVTPGAAARVRFAMRDTAVYAGVAVPLGAAVRDRWGNPRGEPITYAVSAPGTVDVDPQGVATTRAVGRTAIVARHAALADTAYVSVVPRGRLVLWDANHFSSAGFGALVTVDMDGSDLQRLALGTNGSFGVFPAWSPDGSRIAYHRDRQPRVVEVATGRVHEIAPTPQFGHQVRFAPDGSVRFISASAVAWGVWRAEADGSGPRELVRLPEYQPFNGSADLAPDGTRMVYALGNGALRVIDLTTGASRALGVNGAGPRWSPSGDRIAYVTEYPFGGGQIAVVRADGTGARTVTVGGTDSYDVGMAWSPDGAWLLARSARSSTLHLVGVADGTIVPLRLPFALYQPSWR